MDRMDMDLHEHRGTGGFPVDQPIEALRKDHHFVKQLFDRYQNTQDMQVKQEAGPRIVMLLEMHMAVEESVFYPKVHEVAPELVDHGEHEHEEAKQLMEQIKGMNPGEAQYDQIMMQLAEAVLHHVETEERELFPKVEQSNLDLTAIGLQMQAYEANMVSTMARDSAQRGSRP